MKYLFYVFTALFLSVPFALSAENPDSTVADTVIAGKVMKTFQKKYPKITPDEWIVENGKYIITFFDDNKWYDVTITEKGKLENISVIIDYEDLPEAVRNNFEASKYNDLELYKIQEFEQEAVVQYRLFVVDRSEKETILTYDKDGNLIP